MEHVVMGGWCDGVMECWEGGVMGGQCDGKVV